MKKVTTIILFSGYQGLISSILRFIMPLALIFYGWDLVDYTTIYVFQAMSMALPYIFSGFFSDLKGRKQTISIGISIYITGVSILAISISGNNLILIIIGQMLATLSNGVTEVGLSTILVDETKLGQDRTESFGKNFSLRNLMGLIGPLSIGLLLSGVTIGSYIFETFNIFGQPAYISVFVLLAIMGIFGVIFGFYLPKTEAHVIEKNKTAKLSDFTKNQKDMQKAFLAEELLIGFLSGAIVPLINFYVITQFNPSDLQWSFVFGISNSTIAIGNYFVGKYAENFGKGRTTILLNSFAPIFALGIALSPNFLIVSIFYILRSAFANAVHPAWNSWYFSHTLDTARGRTYSVLQVSRRLTRAIGTASGPVFFLSLGTMMFPTISIFYPTAMMIPYFKEKRIKNIPDN